MSLALLLLYFVTGIQSQIFRVFYFIYYFVLPLANICSSVLKLEIWLQPHLSHQNFFFLYLLPSCQLKSLWSSHLTVPKPPRWSPHLVFFPRNNHHQRNGSRSSQSAGHVTTTLKNPQWLPSVNWLRKARPSVRSSVLFTPSCPPGLIFHPTF